MDEKLLKANIRDEGGFWLKWPNSIPAEGKPVQSDIAWTVVEDEEADLISRVIRY